MTAFFQIVIPKRNRSCVTCGGAFISQQEIFSTLLHVQETWQRNDFCLNCYLPKEQTTVWKSRMPVSQELDRDERDLIERAWDHLQSTVTSDQLELQEEAFFLALYLKRKKVLAQRKDQFNHEGREGMLYEHLEKGEMLVVPKVSLLNLSLDVIQKRLHNKIFRPLE